MDIKTNGVSIQIGGQRQPAVPHIYTAGSWRPCIPHVRVDGTYRPACTLETPPEVPTELTDLFMMTVSDSYCGGWSYFEDADPRQGYNGDTIYGTMWFDTAVIKDTIKERVVSSVSLRLHMRKGVGRGVPVDVQLYGTNKAYEGRSGRPALTTSYGTLPSKPNPDEIAELVIPNQVVVDMLNGTICALVLKSNDTTVYEDRVYSRNYARFSGSTSGTADTMPRLTVVHRSE